MKVAIITRRYGDNFGSILQAFALQWIISTYEPDNVILDYDELYHNIRWRIRPLVYDILSFIVKLCPIKCIWRSKRVFFENRNEQKNKFRMFDNRLTKTEKVLRKKSDLRKACEGCSVCICGSDQIWSPILFDENYYLTFLNNTKVKKVAYATSLGVNKKEMISNRMVRLMKRFDKISVREKVGCNIVSSLIGTEIKHVLDPTLLLPITAWKEMESSVKIEGDYILCYFLKSKELPNSFIQSLKKRTHCKVVNIQMYYNINDIIADIHLYKVGPQDFLSLVSKATYVCTNSFHGTIFSYIYKKSFFVFDRFNQNDKANQNSRIDDLLKTLNLECQKVPMGEDTCANINISYPIMNNFDHMRSQSLNFIKESLAIINTLL